LFVLFGEQQMKKLFPLQILILAVAASILLSSCRSQTVTPLSAVNVTITPSHILAPDFTATAPLPQASPTAIPPTASPTAPASPTPQAPINWWNEATFYQIFVGSFLDQDGDGNGDFNGILQKLDTLNDGDTSTISDLGIEGVWLMPIFPSPSYHGYDVTDYYSVNPEYGALEDLKALLESAHQRGIKVILDLPLNHTSDQHPWFQQSLTPDSPYRDWYIWSDTDPGYLGPWGQDVWHEGPQGGYYYGVFWSGMPDLNFANPEVVEEMNKIVTFWLEEVGVDGFRLDGARYIIEEGEKTADTPANHEYYKQLRQVVKAISPEALLLGEVWKDSFTASTYVQGDELDQVLDFDLANAIMGSVISGNSTKALNQMKFSTKLFPGGRSAPFLTNHDQDRVMSQLGGNLEKAKNAAMMLLTAPGTPIIYYGEEIGMLGKRGSENTDIQRRLPMQWSPEANAGFTTGVPWAPVDPSYPEVNVEIESGQPESLLAFYHLMVDLRNAHPALQSGDTFVLDTGSPDVYAIMRSGQGEGLLVLVNLTDQPVEEYSLSLDSGPLKITYALEPLLGDGTFPELAANPEGGLDDYKPLPTLPPNSRFILQLQPLE
jgi:alpha-amylase